MLRRSFSADVRSLLYRSARHPSVSHHIPPYRPVRGYSWYRLFNVPPTRSAPRLRGDHTHRPRHRDLGVHNVRLMGGEPWVPS